MNRKPRFGGALFKSRGFGGEAGLGWVYDTRDY